MKKIIHWIFLGLLLPIVASCQSSQKTKSTSKTLAPMVTVTCILKGCQDSIRLMQFEGAYFKTLQALKPTSDTFYFQLPKNKHQFLYIGSNAQQKKAIILGQEDGVVLQGNCRGITGAKIANSPINKTYENTYAEINKIKGKMNAAVSHFRKTFRDPEKVKPAIEKMKAVDKEKMELLQKTKETSPFVARVVALESYTTFHSDRKGHADELSHFVNTYFEHADLTHADYNSVPYLFEGFKNYATTLSSINIPKAQMEAHLDSTLNKIPQDQRAFRYALGGTMVALQGRNHPSFLTYGKRFVEKYGSDNDPFIAQLKNKIDGAKSFLTGAVAPDFKMNTPEGKEMSLSELRGKVVLVDFWASWCGPCRKENPSVVKMYNRFKEQGFEIIGVSLDRKKDRWVNAIKKDGLEWHHVSDLKGWQNRAAQMYGVRSIPHTVLLDREGKIIARNLRGDVLERQVEKAITGK